jgi:hypothetical protein
LRGYPPCPFREVIAFRDKLIELHKIRISHESLRQILIKEGGHEPKMWLSKLGIMVDLTDKHQECAKIRKSFKGSIL